MTRPIRLGVNIDHVATVRNARGGRRPEPLRAAEVALDAGADGVTAHLREDRRHITDADIEGLTELCARRGKPLNFECAATEEMLAIAERHRPHAACLVPERREEVTTEGGLDVVCGFRRVSEACQRLKASGVRASLFVEPDLRQIEAAARAEAAVVELHTGRLCHQPLGSDAFEAEFERVREAASAADRLGLEVHAGHGLDFETARRVAAVPEVLELNIGHFLVGEAIFTGLETAIRRMRQAMDEGRQ